MRFRVCCVALAVIGLLTLSEAQARQLHAVLIGNTNDGSIGLGVDANVQRMKALIEAIDAAQALPEENNPARANQPKATVTSVTGDSFSCENILAAVNGVKAGADDTVLFYYAGHGYAAEEGDDEFPKFKCGAGTAGLSQITTALLTLKPRLLIAIADTCNAPQKDTVAGPLGKSPEKIPVTKALEQLFMKYKGAVKISSSIKGEYSFYHIPWEATATYTPPGEWVGGWFTRQFLNAIKTTVSDLVDKNDRPNWDTVLFHAMKVIKVPDNPRQHPQYREERDLKPIK